MKTPALKIEFDVVRPTVPSEADQSRRKLIYFAIANLVAFLIAAGIFALLLVGIREGQGFDTAMGSVQRFFASHMGVAALAASTPFFASLLVGQYEMRRARARRARKEAEDKRARQLGELVEERAIREARRADSR